MIPAEAVEAAIRTMPEYTPDEEADSFERETNDQCRAKVERILEAAAPYMLARAWRAGCIEGLATGFGYEAEVLARNPYEATK